MSAEIGIINKHGIALATDSAVTVDGGQGYYTTANKLFALSKHQPVAIMIYSNADYMGVPVEIIVKEYRKYLDEKVFENLKDYWNDFIKYLLEFSNKRIQNFKEFYLSEVLNFLEFVKSKISEEVDNYYDDLDCEWNKDEVNEKILEIKNNIITSFYSDYQEMENDESFANLYEEIEKTLEPDIKELVKEILGADSNPNVVYKLIQCAIMILTKNHKLGNRTGIVIAGYGNEEIFPTIISGEFMGCFFGKLKYSVTNEGSLNDCEGGIYPFAQADVVNTFITGIDNSMINAIMNTIDTSNSFKKCSNSSECRNQLKKELLERIEGESDDYHINPIMNTISTAPKEELAQMAETLVNITSFRRRLSFDQYSQTVGGPIDVLVITKGDGLVWLKRKHYFDKDLNYNFLHNYYKN